MDRLKVIAKALDDKRVTDIKVLDISELSSLSDYFVICSCGSGVQVRAAADEVEAWFGDEVVEEREVEVAGDAEDIVDADLD